MLLGIGHGGEDRDGDGLVPMTALGGKPGQDGDASLLLLHLSEEVAISASDHSLGLGAEGGEWMTEVTLLVTVLGA